MSEFKKGSIIDNLLRLGPLIILYISVLNEIDLNYLSVLREDFPVWSHRKIVVKK